VPLYARQAHGRAGRDDEGLLAFGDCLRRPGAGDAIVEAWPEAPPTFLLRKRFYGRARASGKSRAGVAKKMW